MHSLALPLGLAAVTYGLVLRHLWLPLPYGLTTAIAIVASWLVAKYIAKRLVSDARPPEWMTLALVAAAGAFLFLSLLRMWFYIRVIEYKDWLLLLTLVLTVRYLKPRALLFLGVLAFAMQLLLLQLPGLLGAFIKAPDWIFYCVNLGLATWVANWLCFRPDVATDRVKDFDVLWFFGAAGAASLMIGANDFMFRRWTENLIWLSYLASFLLLVRHIGEGEGGPDREVAERGLIVTMFVALYMSFAGVFKVQEMIIFAMPLSALETWRAWLPMLVCVALAVGTMVSFKLQQRLRNQAPGRKMLLWGSILAVACIILGGSIFGAGGNEMRQSHVMDFIGPLIAFAVVVGPVAVVAQFLLGVGLLRQVFNLRPPPRD